MAAKTVWRDTDCRPEGTHLILKERRQRYSASTNAENYNQMRMKRCRELKRAAVSAHEAKVPCIDRHVLQPQPPGSCKGNVILLAAAVRLTLQCSIRFTVGIARRDDRPTDAALCAWTTCPESFLRGTYPYIHLSLSLSMP